MLSFMTPTVSFNIPVEDFRNLIAETVREELKVHQISHSPIDDKPLKRREVAGILGITPITLTKWCKEGRIKFSQIGKRYYFNREDVQDALESNPKYKRK